MSDWDEYDDTGANDEGWGGPVIPCGRRYRERQADLRAMRREDREAWGE